MMADMRVVILLSILFGIWAGEPAPGHDTSRDDVAAWSFLHACQLADGGWPCVDAGGPSDPVASGMAVLALLYAGAGPGDGGLRIAALDRGLAWLVRQVRDQEEGMADIDRCRALFILGLAEDCGRLDAEARAVVTVLRARTLARLAPGDGPVAWRDGEGWFDTTATAWGLMAFALRVEELPGNRLKEWQQLVAKALITPTGTTTAAHPRRLRIQDGSPVMDRDHPAAGAFRVVQRRLDRKEKPEPFPPVSPGFLFDVADDGPVLAALNSHFTGGERRDWLAALAARRRPDGTWSMPGSDRPGLLPTARGLLLGLLLSHPGRGTMERYWQCLDWLQRHQGEDGSWDESTLHARCRPEAPCPAADNPIIGNDRVLTTALVCQAFLSYGFEHRSPNRYRSAVKGAVDFLVRQQRGDGAFGDSLVGHAATLTALADALSVTRDEDLRPRVIAGLRHLIRLARYDGMWGWQDHFGWSATAMAITAYSSCRMADVVDDAMAGIHRICKQRVSPWKDYEAADWQRQTGQERRDQGWILVCERMFHVAGDPFQRVLSSQVNADLLIDLQERRREVVWNWMTLEASTQPIHARIRTWAWLVRHQEGLDGCEDGSIVPAGRRWGTAPLGRIGETAFWLMTNQQNVGCPHCAGLIRMPQAAVPPSAPKTPGTP